MTSEITKAKALKAHHLFYGKQASEPKKKIDIIHLSGELLITNFKIKKHEKAKKQFHSLRIIICLLNKLQRNKRKQK